MRLKNIRQAKSVLERLFTSKTRIMILQYLFFQKKETHLRAMAKEMKVSPGAVKRELDNLLSAGIVCRKKNRIRLESAPFLEDLKQVFIKTDYIGNPIKEALKKTDARFILIFGSFAKGEYIAESDIDLMIIGNCRQPDIFRLLKPVEKLIKREINPVIWTMDDLRKNKGKALARDIAKKDKIMLKGDENEFQRIISG